MDSSKETRQKEITVYLDRLEPLEDGTATAVFLVEDEDDEYREFTLPANFLPEGAADGEYLTLTISRDTESAQNLAKFTRINELEDGTATAVFTLEDAACEFTLPADFLPEGAADGECLTISISRDTDKTQAALDEARELLNNLEE